MEIQERGIQPSTATRVMRAMAKGTRARLERAGQSGARTNNMALIDAVTMTVDVAMSTWMAGAIAGLTHRV
jgi:hypothetical protein